MIIRLLEQTALLGGQRHVSLSWNENFNMDGWVIYRYPVRVRGKIPCTSTRVQVHAKYNILLCTRYILVAKGRQMIVAGVYLRRGVCTRARTTLQLPRHVALDRRKMR